MIIFSLIFFFFLINLMNNLPVYRNFSIRLMQNLVNIDYYLLKRQSADMFMYNLLNYYIVPIP